MATIIEKLNRIVTYPPTAHGIEIKEARAEIVKMRAALIQIRAVCEDNPSMTTNFIDEVAHKALNPVSEKRPDETMEAYVIRLIREEERERCANVVRRFDWLGERTKAEIAAAILDV